MVDARTFQALSDPTRLKILSLLGVGSMNVSAMVEKLDCTQPAVSRHLKVLKQAGLIVDVRRGKWIEYSSNPSAVAEAAEYLKALYEAGGGKAEWRESEGSTAEPAGRAQESAGRPGESALQPTKQTVRRRRPTGSPGESPRRPRKSPAPARKLTGRDRESSKPQYVVETGRDFIDDLML